MSAVEPSSRTSLMDPARAEDHAGAENGVVPEQGRPSNGESNRKSGAESGSEDAYVVNTPRSTHNTEALLEAFTSKTHSLENSTDRTSQRTSEADSASPEYTPSMSQTEANRASSSSAGHSKPFDQIEEGADGDQHQKAPVIDTRLSAVASPPPLPKTSSPKKRKNLAHLKTSIVSESESNSLAETESLTQLHKEGEEGDADEQMETPVSQVVDGQEQQQQQLQPEEEASNSSFSAVTPVATKFPTSIFPLESNNSNPLDTVQDIPEAATSEALETIVSNTSIAASENKDDDFEITEQNPIDDIDYYLDSQAKPKGHSKSKSKSHKKSSSISSKMSSNSSHKAFEETARTNHKRPHFQSLVGIPSVRSPLYSVDSMAIMQPQLIDAIAGAVPADAWEWHSTTTVSADDISAISENSRKSTRVPNVSSSAPQSPELAQAASNNGSANLVATIESVLQRDDRGYVIWNLVETERNYYHQMKVLVTGFKEKMLSDRIMAETATNLVFAGVEDLRDFHKTFLEELEDLVSVNHWDTQTTLIGHLFVKHKSTLVRLYTYFIDSYAMSQKSIKREEKDNPAYVQFMKDALKSKETNRQQLKDFMILPVQRTARYHLLLKDLLKRTPETHPDYSNLNSAWEAMNVLAASVNEKKRQEEQQSGLFDAFEQTKNCPPTLIKHSRKLIFTVDVLEQKTGKPYRLFLCSDLLMIANANGRGVLFGRNAAEHGYKFVRWLDLLEIRIDDSDQDNRANVKGSAEHVNHGAASNAQQTGYFDSAPSSPAITNDESGKTSLSVLTTSSGTQSSPVSPLPNSEMGTPSLGNAAGTPVLGKDMVRVIHDPAHRDPTDSYTQT